MEFTCMAWKKEELPAKQQLCPLSTYGFVLIYEQSPSSVSMVKSIPTCSSTSLTAKSSQNALPFLKPRSWVDRTTHSKSCATPASQSLIATLKKSSITSIG